MDAMRKSEWAELGGHVLVLLVGAYFIWQRDQALVQMVTLLSLCIAATGVAGLLHWLLAKPRPDSMFLAGPVFALVSALVIYLLRVQITGITPVLIGLLSLGVVVAAPAHGGALVAVRHIGAHRRHQSKRSVHARGGYNSCSVRRAGRCGEHRCAVHAQIEEKTEELRCNRTEGRGLANCFRADGKFGRAV